MVTAGTHLTHADIVSWHPSHSYWYWQLAPISLMLILTAGTHLTHTDIDSWHPSHPYWCWQLAPISPILMLTAGTHCTHTDGDSWHPSNSYWWTVDIYVNDARKIIPSWSMCGRWFPQCVCMDDAWNMIPPSCPCGWCMEYYSLKLSLSMMHGILFPKLSLWMMHGILFPQAVRVDDAWNMIPPSCSCGWCMEYDSLNVPAWVMHGSTCWHIFLTI